jgi:DNA replication protein DnaC
VKDNGVSLYIYGPKGCGKSGAATVILKEARAWGFTAYSISVTELREAVRTHAAFDIESTVMDRCRVVDFLLLDDLRVEDATEKMFTINDIRNLVVSRHDRGLPTLITSNLQTMEWGQAPANAPGIRDAIEKCCAVLKVDGPNRHKLAQDSKNNFLK